jgi:hypothetical protein
MPSSMATLTTGRGGLVLGEPAYMLRFAQTVGGTGATFNQLVQPIEDVRTFAGQQVTISFYMRSTASITLPTVQFVQNFGTGGSPSDQVFTNLLTSVSITTSWQRIQATVTVPSILGKALGSNGDSNLSLDIGFPLNDTFSVDIAQVQVEPGPVATPFEQRPIGTELALCQRYFQRLGVYLVADVASGNPLGALAYLSPNTRTTPVIGIISTDSTNLSARTVTANARNVYFFASSLSAGSAQLSEFFSASAEL